MGLLAVLRQWFGGPQQVPDFLIAGLGNPGENYRSTRHNAGFMVVDRLCEVYQIPLDLKRFTCRFGLGDVAGRKVVLAKPQAFMNRSGLPVLRLMSYYGISGCDLLIIHDDIDIAFGRLKIKEKGGHGGHNGVKSLMEALGNGDFSRLRIGVGRPERGGDVIQHVLEPFRAGEQEQLDTIMDRAVQAVVTVLSHGAKFGMNRFNRKP
ncbi:MAG: aminoacyl-tRNA hydrolase [Desulfobacterales bacterium]|nr:aminoacyl-tRNA hydrolase [Desulfobacterales bacterium]